VAEAGAWRGSLEQRPRLAPRFYIVIAVSMLVGLALDYMGINAVAMLFWSAVLNGLLAPPLIAIVILLTSNPKVMGKRTNLAFVAIAGVDHGCRDDVCSRGDDWNGTLMTSIRKDGSRRFAAVVSVTH
jgi:Mn2+/Fe2+ NRAMP family transporter